MENSSPCKGILAKIHKVMGIVSRIEKDRSNEAGRYKYASEKVIKEIMHSVFTENGIVLQIETSNPRVLNATNRQEKVELAIATLVDVSYRLWDVDTGEWIGGTFVGAGNGRDDKGLYAAITGAIKYMLTGNFLIPTGDDPEDDFFDRHLGKQEVPPESPGKAPKTAKQPEGKVDKPAPKAEDARPAEAAKQAKPGKPAEAKENEGKPEDALPLSEKSKNAIIDAFAKIDMDIFDLVKSPLVPKDIAKWTMGDRKKMLIAYTALTSNGSKYSKEEFIAGKLP